MEAKALKQKVEDWKEHPDGLGSESKVAVIIGKVAAKVGEDVPSNVMEALRTLSLRGSMRDIASTIRDGEECVPYQGLATFQRSVDPVASNSRVSWGEALAAIAKYFVERASKLE